MSFPIFGGRTYNPARDRERLQLQLNAVLTFMRDHRWHTLREISQAVGAPEASVSARLRDLRKPPLSYRVGAFCGDYSHGLWYYRLIEDQL